MEIIRVVVKFLQEFYTMMGQYSIEVELEQGSTVRDLIEYIDRNIKESFKKHILDDRGNIRYPAEIAVNGRRIEFLNGLETILRDGDNVVFSPRAFFVL